MAQNTTLNIAAKTWTMITDADVSAITFQNISQYTMLVKATTDTTAPTNQTGALRYDGGQGERNAMMSDLFPGLTGRDRLWVYCSDPASVFVSHA